MPQTRWYRCSVFAALLLPAAAFSQLELGLSTAAGGAPDGRSNVVEPNGGARVAIERVVENYQGPHRYDQLAGPTNPDHDDAYLYRLPYGDAVSFPVLQGYGSKLSHRGTEFFTVDFQMAEGTLVHSARDGLVVLVEDSFSEACWSEYCGRYANFVVVLHTDGTTGEYFHLQQHGALVKPGDTVYRGQALARSGNTGYTTAPHLHFGVYRANQDGTTQSIAVQFLTRDGSITEPRAGARYQNANDVSRPGERGDIAVLP